MDDVDWGLRHTPRWEGRSMVKDEQVFRLRQLLRPSTTLNEIGQQARMDPKTARKYFRLSTLPSENQRTRTWPTRTDPLAGVWEEVVRQLQRNPTTPATAVLSALEVFNPESVSRAQLRTLQRRLKGWKRNNASEFGALSDPQAARTWLLGLLQSESSAALIEHEFADRGDLLPVAELLRLGRSTKGAQARPCDFCRSERPAGIPHC